MGPESKSLLTALGNFCFNARQNRMPPSHLERFDRRKENPHLRSNERPIRLRGHRTFALFHDTYYPDEHSVDMSSTEAPAAPATKPLGMRVNGAHPRPHPSHPCLSTAVYRRKLTRVWIRKAVARAEEGLQAHVGPDELREEGEAES